MIQYILELRQVAATTTYEKQCRKQYTPIDEFFKEHDVLPEQQKHRFALNAETLFLVRLGQARDAAQARAGELGLKITRLLVPFPATWTRLMQQSYAAYFRITWKLDPEFIYESEAIAHLVVSKSMMPGFQGETFRTLIVVDLGAHILEKLGKKFTASYMQHCDAMVKGDAFIMCAASSTIHQIPVSDEKSRSMYNECFSNVFETLRKALNASEANKRADKTKVVLVGVGFQNMSLRKKVKKQVKSRGFLLHDFKDFCLDITHIVAVGAASAIVNASTVEQFMQGARFVVQGSSGTTTSSATIWSSGSSRTAQVSVLEADETLIVKCSPVPKTSRASGIDATLFYDFSELKLPRGNYRIHMEPPVPSANGYSITISYKGISSHADDGRETRDGSRDYGIYYDYGSRLCFEDIDKSASREKNNQASKDWEELEKLLYITDEALEATILARTKYRTVAKGRATLPAL
ncbi:hypothetical protein HC256_005891 [Beauveria bassiana]|nr:hypothetical protein HC256_005891 [Beauveria bassiana]